MDLGRVLLVLDKVQHPDNLGSALRAMKNSGLARIALSEPRTRDLERAKVMAIDARDLLETLVVAPDISAAVAGATLVGGFTSRAVDRRPTLLLHEFVEEAARETRSGGEVAFVFGNEARGLSDAELDHCHRIVTIPTSDAKRSINLAQSVMLAAHACFLASITPATPAGPTTPADHARAGTLEALWSLMRETLLAADFLNRQNPDDILGELKRSLERSRLTQRETELWLGAFKHLRRAVD